MNPLTYFSGYAPPRPHTLSRFDLPRLPTWAARSRSQRFLSILGALICLAITTPHASRAQPTSDDAQAPDPETKPRFETEGRVITGFQYELEKPAATQGGFREDEYGFYIRQIRLEFEGELNKTFEAELSLELSDALDPKVSLADIEQPQFLRDAFLDVRFTRAFRLRAGRFKRPMSRLQLLSVSKIPVRNRGLLNNLVIEDAQWGDREVGAMLFGKFRHPDVHWYLAAMNPYWTPDFRREGYDVLGRLEYQPWKSLSIGVNGGRKSMKLQDLPAESGHAFGGDVRVRVADAEILVEGLVADLVREEEEPQAFGGLVMASYQIYVNPVLTMEPVVFFEVADANSIYTGSEAARGVVGLNWIYLEELRIMPQVAVTKPLGTVNEQNPWEESYEYYLQLSLQL